LQISRADQATLSIEPLNARLYGGAAAGSFSISASEIPKIAFKQKLTGVQLNALLADLFLARPSSPARGTSLWT